MLNIVINIFILHFPIMLALCLMFSMTHFAQNYAGIIGRSLIGIKEIPKSKERNFSMLYKTAKG